MSIETVSLIITIILALLGYLITYWNNINISKRKEQLELIDKRISEFYGPLYIAAQTSQRAKEAFFEKIKYKRGGSPPARISEENLKEWRVWAESVFMPNNERIEKLITEKAYLIQEPIMPECLLEFITHLSSFKAIVRKWQLGDYSDIDLVSGFPPELHQYATNSYQQLKEKQLELIGKMKFDIQVTKKYSL